MTEHPDDDRELYQRFQASRARDLDGAPPFERVLAGRGPVPRRAPRLLAPALGLAVLALILVALLRPDRSVDSALPPEVMALGRLESPTDFLLHVAGTEFLRSVPELGAEAVPLLPRSPAGAGSTEVRRNRL